MAAFFISDGVPNEGSMMMMEPVEAAEAAEAAETAAPVESAAVAASVRDALSAVRPSAATVAQDAVPAPLQMFQPTTSGDGDDEAKSVLLMAPTTDDAASGVWSSRSSVFSQHDANDARSILNSNPANHPRSVVMHFEDAGSTAAAHDAVIEKQIGRIRASLAHTQQVAGERLKAEAAALGNLQPHTWDSLVQLALDAMCSRAGCTRDAFGWDRAKCGAKCMCRLRDTMKHLSAFCQRRHSGLGPQASLNILQGGGITLPKELLPHVKSLSVAWTQDVRLRERRLDQYLANCERAFADFIVTMKGAAKAAWKKHQRLTAAVEGMEARLRSESETHHKQLAGPHGEDPEETAARIDTASAVSKVAQPLRVQQRVSDMALATQLRNRSDRLAATIQVLLRQQLQAVRDKGVLLANVGVSGKLPATLARVRALDTKVAALGEQVVKLNAERADVEHAWSLSQNKTLTLEAGGTAASTAAQRVVRETLRAQAQARARRLAEVDTVIQALTEKLHAEAIAARRANFQHFATTAMETRSVLGKRVNAARMLADAETLRLRQELKGVLVELERNVSVRGGSTPVAQMRTAANSAVAHHMTQRVRKHLSKIDEGVKDLLTFIYHLE